MPRILQGVGRIGNALDLSLQLLEVPFGSLSITRTVSPSLKYLVPKRIRETQPAIFVADDFDGPYQRDSEKPAPLLASCFGAYVISRGFTSVVFYLCCCLSFASPCAPSGRCSTRMN